MAELTLENLAQRVAALERKLGNFDAAGTDPQGTVGDEQSDDPAELARWLAAFDVIPAAVMSPEEEAAWNAARSAQKQLDAGRIDRLASSLPGAAG